MNRRFILFLLVLLALALPLVAGQRVSRIEVESSVPAKIVIAQSALVEGRSYSTADLEVAVARLRRLPFVYDARYRLEGETLILDVDSTTRFFGDLDLEGAAFERGEVAVARVGGGGRLFLGSSGVGEAKVSELIAEGGNATMLEAEYANYAVGGSRFFAIAGIGKSFSNDDGGLDLDPSLRLTVGYPLTLRSTLTATARREGFSSSRSPRNAPRPLQSESEAYGVDFRWTYDTTEDPFFARQGLLLAAGPAFMHEDSKFEALVTIVPSGETLILRSASEGDTTSLDADAKAFWPVRERGALFGMLGAAYESRDFESSVDDSPLFRRDTDATNVRLAVGYAHNLFDFHSPGGATRHRVEFSLGAARSSYDRDFFGNDSFDSKSVSAAYALRRNFATVRVGLSYTFD